MKRAAALALLLVVALGPSRGAHAQGAPPSAGHAGRAGPTWGNGQDKASSAPASSPKAAEAARLKAAGDVLMDQDRAADALALYEKAYALASDPALLYNQGRALEALGEYPAALDKLEDFDRHASPALRARVPGLEELLTSLRGRIGVLVVRTNATNARLLVRQKDAGTVHGETRVRTRAGSASVEVTAEGYEPFKREVDVSAGAELVIEAQLAPKKRDTFLVVRAAPTSEILLDGSTMGRSPLELRVVPGPHELVARADGYDDERVPMTLTLGERRNVDLELKKSPGITSKWWFWTGLGVIVLGGAAAATTIALTTEKSPQRGTIGTLPGP